MKKGCGECEFIETQGSTIKTLSLLHCQNQKRTFLEQKNSRSLKGARVKRQGGQLFPGRGSARRLRTITVFLGDILDFYVREKTVA